MRGNGYLFFEEDLDAQLRARQQSVSHAVDRIPKDQFLVSSDQEVVDQVVAGLTVQPIVLHEESTTMNQDETQVDVSQDPMRYFRDDRTGPFFIPGTKVGIDIPFTGEEWIFRYRTNPWSTVFPCADVQNGHLRLTIARPHDSDPSSFKTEYKREIKLIREYVDRARRQVHDYNGSLPDLVKQAVRDRRDRLERHGDIAALLNIPLATKLGVPSVEPVKLEICRAAPLPVPPKSGLIPEPGIADQTFENILRFIRHQCRTFERTPSTYAVHGEEDLRNIILAQFEWPFSGRRRGRGLPEQGQDGHLY